MVTEAVILAGGRGTRVSGLAQNLPKVMLEVAAKPFIAWQLELLKNNGIRRAVICAGYLGEKIRDFVRQGESFGIKVEYSFDGPSLLGTGGAVKKALALLGNTFFVMYGDSYLPTDFKAVSNYFLTQDKVGLMVILKNNDRWDRSNVLYKNGRIQKYDKKNTSCAMEYIDYGLLLFKKEAFLVEDFGEVFELDVVCQGLIRQDQLLAYEAKERFFEIGSPEGLQETRAYLTEVPKNKLSGD
jgi:MurNAc alpha-1-phosphate uridylyltransferase